MIRSRLPKYVPALLVALWGAIAIASSPMVLAQSVAKPPTRFREFWVAAAGGAVNTQSLAITVNSQVLYPQSILLTNSCGVTLSYNLEGPASPTITMGGANNLLPPYGAVSVLNVDGVWRQLSVSQYLSSTVTVSITANASY